jgi:dipeptidyl-peptidase-4
MQSLAELGFVVVCIDGMGTPWRSKTFHEAYYADLGDNTIPDQVSGMKDLAAQYPSSISTAWACMATPAAAMLPARPCFTIPISSRWALPRAATTTSATTKTTGPRSGPAWKKNPDGTSNYDSQANQNFAKNLKGHLLLAHGTMDDNVPPNNTLLMVDALIKANKDFDLLLIPNVPHGYGPASQYMMRRRWDYFVRYLAGGTPPVEYQMKPFSVRIRITVDGDEVRCLNVSFKLKSINCCN